MDISDLTLRQLREIASMFPANQERSGPTIIDGNLRKVIVRSRDAGVQYGKLVGYSPDGSLVHLIDAKQMWSWTAKEGGTLIDCAVYGVKAGKASVASPAVTVIGACAIIDVIDAAAETLDAAKWQ